MFKFCVSQRLLEEIKMMLFPVTPQAFVYTYSCVCFVLDEIQKIGEIHNR